MALSAGAALVAAGRPPDWPAMLGAGVQSALLYLPVVFVLEEVAFRGALDAHVHRPGERRGLATAVFVSVLWGMVAPAARGTPRRSAVGDAGEGAGRARRSRRAAVVRLAAATGTLAAPGLAHALIDGVRNGLLAGL